MSDSGAARRATACRWRWEKLFAARSALESLLFVADEPVEPVQFTAGAQHQPGAGGAGPAAVGAGGIKSPGHGLRLLMRGGRYLLISAPAAAPLIEAFLNLDATTKLHRQALETLAIVAYRQPVTRAQVEAVRGVDCSGVLRSLLQRGLLEETGRLNYPGRPVLYGVTDLFLQHFGLTGMHDLPPLEDGNVQRLDAVLA